MTRLKTGSIIVPKRTNPHFVVDENYVLKRQIYHLRRSELAFILESSMP